MANKTDFLNLTLPGNNEFNDTWDVPMNENSVAIDQFAEETSNEILAARFSKATLSEFLEVSLNADGTLKPSDEQDAAQNSPVYGDDDGAGNDYELKDRLDRADREVFDARERSDTLVNALARRARDFDHPDYVVDGAKTGSNQPNFLSSSGDEFILNGDPTPIKFNIDGFYMELAADENVQVTGGDGTKYLVAQIPTSRYVVLDKSTQQDGVSTTNALNNDKVQILVDATQDFTTNGAKVGHILEVLNTTNLGEYIITEIAPGGNNDQILVIGKFPSLIGSINYNILDPLRPEFTVETTYTPTAGKVIVAEGSFVSGSLVSDLTYNFKGLFESDYEAIDVSTITTFEQIFNHNLGFIPKEIHIYAAQANDDTQPVEELAQALVGNDLGTSVNNTLVFTPGIFNPGTGDATYTPASLVGDVTVGLTGSVFMLRSVQVKVTKTQIFVKNIKNNHYYRDYDGTDRDAGFLKVVCRK